MYRFVDDRDVACAHVQAFETPSASGRYCLGGQFAHFPEVLPEYYPTLPLPERWVIVSQYDEWHSRWPCKWETQA